MKKIVSVLLFLVLTIGIITSAVLSSLASGDDEEIPDYSVFEMEYLMNIHEYDGTLFNGSTDVYEKVRTDDLFHRSLHNYLSEHSILKGITITQVQVYDNGIDLLHNPEHFYTVVLMDILGGKYQYDLGVDAINSTIVSNGKKSMNLLYKSVLDSAMGDIVDAEVPSYNTLINSRLDNLSEAEIAELSKSVANTNSNILKYVDLIGTLDLIKELADMGLTVYNAVEKVNTLYAIAGYNIEMINLLKDMRSATSNANLKVAIDGIVEIYEQRNTPEEVREGMDAAGLSVAKATAEKLLFQTTKYVATTIFSSIGAFSLAWDLGTTAANLLFNVDDLNTGYLTVDAAAIIEDAMHSCMKTYGNAFVSTRTVANAERCRTAYKAVLTTQYYATNMMQKVAYSLETTWWGNLKSLFGCSKYDDVVDVCDSTRSIIKGRYNTWVGLAQKTYKNLYGVSFDHAISAPVVSVTSVSFKIGSYTLFSNEGLCNPATAYPTNAVGREISYSSSNYDVAVVGAYGNIMAVGPGEAIITATSENGTKATCKITILPYDVSVVDNRYTIDRFTGGTEPANIPGSLNGTTVTAIADDAFKNASVTSVTIPRSVTSIGNYAFYGCTSLVSISIPDSVTSIGASAFEDCTSLTSVTIPDSVTSIVESVFKGCTSLISITIPDSVTSIGTSAFEDCTSLTSVTIPDSVTSIVKSVFKDCTSLTSITIPDSVTSIGASAFENCTSLTSVTIPDSVTSIEYEAFYKCTGLKEITISASTEIDESGTAFGGCKNIEKVTLTKGTGTMQDYWSFNDMDDFGFSPWYVSRNKIKEIVIENGITNISAYAFFECTSLKSITIPDSVTNLGFGAFEVCTALESITIPDSVTSIGGWAFGQCDSLKSITIPDGVTSISDHTFFGCDSLTSVTIPDDVTTIDHDAFSYCANLTSITIPDSVTSIGDNAFSACRSLVSITIPDSITSIAEDVFSNCLSLASVTIPDSVTTIGSYAFFYCVSLESVTIPDSVTSIGDSAFSQCESINSITIPDSVTSIGSNAFYKCKSLTSITIPDGVTSIDSLMFSYCESLTSVTIPNGVTTIGYRAFYCCTSLTDVYYNGTEEEWDKITIDSYNDELSNAEIHFLGEETDVVPENGITITLTDSNGNVVSETVVEGDETEYSFTDLEDGEYTVTVSKETYATREYTVTATDGKASCEFKLNHTGDINGDGKISVLDYTQLLRHVKKTSSIDGYAFDCADVNGDDKLTISDYTKLLRHVKKTELLW